jgi:hypothetical protein
MKCESYYRKTDKHAIEHSESSSGYCSDQLASQHCTCRFINPDDIRIGSGAKPECVHFVDRHLTLAYYLEEESGGSTTTTPEHLLTSFWSRLQLHSPLPPLLSLSHPPSPSTTARTLTSITDPNTCLLRVLLRPPSLTTPASFHPLSSLIMAASTSEPPHILIISGFIT